MKLACVIVVLAVCCAQAKGQEARQAAGVPERFPPARFVPREDLLVYFEFDGLESHAAAWRASAAFKLLNETSLGLLVEDLALQWIELIQETTPAEQRVAAADVVAVVKHVVRNGFVVALLKKNREHMRCVVVVRRGDRAEIKQLIDTAGAPQNDVKGKTTSAISLSPELGHKINWLGINGIWFVKNGDLVLLNGTDGDEILAIRDSRKPSAVDHPLRVELLRAKDGLNPVAIGFVDRGLLGQLSPDAVGVGLDGLKRMTLQWGFDDRALVTRFRIEAPAPRRGALALLDQPAFRLTTLPRLPRDLTSLFVLSADVAKTYDQVDTLLKRFNLILPTDETNPGILDRHGIDLRKQLLTHLGPQFVFYSQAPREIDPATAASMLMSRVSEFTLAAQVRDEAAVARAIDSLVKSFTSMLRDYLRGKPRNRVAPSLAFLKFQKLAGSPSEYVLELPTGLLPPPFVTKLRPTIAVSRDQLVVGASASAVEQALAASGPWRPSQVFVPAVNKLPPEMICLGLSDPRAGTAIFVKALPVVIRQIDSELVTAERRAGKTSRDVFLRLDPAIVPAREDLDRWLFPSSTAVSVDSQGALLTHRAAVPSLTSPAASIAAGFFLVRAIQAALEPTRRELCGNNLRRIVEALHDLRAAKQAFPRPMICGADGRPLLSWRVAILPFIDQQELYDKFNRSEPWDSPHNKALLKEMPAVFRCPSRPKVDEFLTGYRIIVGKGALFEGDKEVGSGDVTDGTANTLMVVEAKEVVPWTKPDELLFDPAAAPSLYGAGSSHQGGFNAAMANRSVHFLRNAIDLDLFRSLITRAGGEAVANPGAF